MRTSLHQPTVYCGDEYVTVSHCTARRFEVQDGQEVDEQTFFALVSARAVEAAAAWGEADIRPIKKRKKQKQP